MKKKQLKKYLIMCGILAFAMYLAGFLFIKKPASLRDQCEYIGATWLEQYKECELPATLPVASTKDAFETFCSQYKGSYNKCSSSCRHNTDSNKICTSECVPVCMFK
jgi:hypothetical protein